MSKVSGAQYRVKPFLAEGRVLWEIQEFDKDQRKWFAINTGQGLAFDFYGSRKEALSTLRRHIAIKRKALPETTTYLDEKGLEILSRREW